MEYVVDKAALGWVFFEYRISVSPANSHSTNCFTFINHPIIDDT
jgi:hypothetical protein